MIKAAGYFTMITPDISVNHLIGQIRSADKQVRNAAREKMNSLVKPPGSLGRLEDCAIQYAAARGDLDAPLCNPVILTFAADHGITEEGISITDAKTTTQMVQCMIQGGAGISVLTRLHGIQHRIIDVGMMYPCASPCIINRSIAKGTRNFTQGPAMTEAQCISAIKAGMAEAETAIVRTGSTLLGTGEIGIGNTTPSAALYSVLLDLPPEDVCGYGSGISQEQLQHKIQLVKKGIQVNRTAVFQGPFQSLTALGGFEIAAITGMILQAAALRIPVLIDGYIASAAAIAAIRMKQEVLDYCFFSHLSGDHGHLAAMTAMGIRPLLDLQLRLGEGTGAALAYPVIRSAHALLHQMMSFSRAGISL